MNIIKLAKQAEQPTSITFNAGNAKWVMRITSDGRIEVNEGVEVNEAAQKVLDALQQLLTKGLDKAVADEREACAKVCESYLSESPYSWGSTTMAEAIRARGTT